MAEATVEKKLIVADVVSALTGSTATTETQSDLRDQMERAAADFDKRTAAAFGKALLDSLTEDPGNLRQLEALLILGLAHPDVLRKNRISLAVEGRRLAILLERSGEVDRARSVLELLSTRMPEERTIDHELAGLLRRSGNTEELVERYLKRAESLIAHSKVNEAIPWLQEILLLDRTRRDVARMIRDLRYEEAERKVRSGRRNRLLATLVLLTSGLTALGYREFRTYEAFQELPDSSSGTEEILTARLEALQTFMDKKRFWAGYFAAKEEIADIEGRLDSLESYRQRQVDLAEMERDRLREMAGSTRLLGLQHVERGEFDEAAECFRRALSFSQPDWEHRERVEADLAALEKLKESTDQ